MVIQHLRGSGFDLDGLGIGLHKCFSRIFKEKCEGELISPVPRDDTRLVPSRVSNMEESNTLQPRTRDAHTARA